MVRGVAAEAAREAIVHLDGVTGKVIGEPQIRDISQHDNVKCEAIAPRD